MSIWPFLAAPVQRSGAVPVARSNVGAAGDEHLCDCVAAVDCGLGQPAAAAVGREGFFGKLLDDHTLHLDVAVGGSELERCVAELGAGGDVGAAVEEEFCDSGVAVEGGPVQRRAAVLVLDRYIGTLLN